MRLYPSTIVRERSIPREVAERLTARAKRQLEHFVREIPTVFVLWLYPSIWLVNTSVSRTHLLMSLEGMLVRASVIGNYACIPVDHTAPIPIKMFRCWNSHRNYFSFATTFPLLARPGEEHEGKQVIYVPFKHLYAPAVLTDDGSTFVRIKIESGKTKLARLDEFLADGYVLRGARYSELLSLWIRTHGTDEGMPKSLCGAKVEESAGPFRDMLTSVPMLDAVLVFVVAGFPEYVRWLLEEIAPFGYGWRGQGMIDDLETRPLEARVTDPRKVLFAEVEIDGKVVGYSLLRPMPKWLWSDDDVLWGRGVNESLMRPSPPYHYVRARGRLWVEPHYLPGTIVRRLPDNIEFIDRFPSQYPEPG